MQYLFHKKYGYSFERRFIISRNNGVLYPIALIIFICLSALPPHDAFAGQASSKENFFGRSDSPLKISQIDSLVFDEKTGILETRGNNVRVESNNDVFEFKEGAFNVNDHTWELHAGELFMQENNIHIRGDVLQKSAMDTYKIEHFRLTTCDNETPSWSITGSEIKVVKEGYARIKGAAFRIHDFPVLYLPWMIFPAKTERQTGLLLPQFGYSTLNGGGMELPFFWAISDHTDATLYERYMNNRGLMHGLEFRYIADDASKGEFLFDNLRDKIKLKNLTALDQARVSPFERTNQDRYWLRGRFNQDFAQGMTARADMDLVSDQDYLREFEGELVGLEDQPDLKQDFGRPLEERYSSFRRSALRLSRDGEDYSLQGSGYYYQKFDNQSGVESFQPLAGAFYSLLPTRLSRLPLFFDLAADYNYTRSDSGVKGNNLSVNPEISYPEQLGDYLKLNSSLNYSGNLESFDAPSGNQESIVRNAFQGKIALSTVLDRIFAFGWKDATKLKHKLTPSLSYEYGKFSNIPVNQDQDESPWFDPVKPGSKLNRIGLSFENLLDASLKNEKGEVSYRQWAQFNITQRYDLEELQRNDIKTEDKKPLEPLLATLILRPFKDLNLRANAAWDHYQDKISTAVFSLDLAFKRSVDRIDRYSIDYVKDTVNNDSLILGADVKLIDGFSAGVSLRRNLDLNYNIRTGLRLQYQAQCWAITLGMEKEALNSSLRLKFRLAGF
jgi:LPS-assembly protein